jgi:hypothetical protein
VTLEYTPVDISMSVVETGGAAYSPTVLRTRTRRTRSTFPIGRWPEGHERQLLDCPPTGGGRAVVAPAKETAQHPPDDRRDEPVAALVVGEDPFCLVRREDAMHRHEALAAAPNLVCQPGVDVVKPSGPPAPARGHDGLPGARVVSNDLEDRLAVQPRLPARVDEEEEPVAQEDAEMSVIEVDGQSQE